MDGLRTTSSTVVRDAKQFNRTYTAEKRQPGTQLPRIPRKDTGLVKGGGGKTTVKVQVSEKLENNSTS